MRHRDVRVVAVDRLLVSGAPTGHTTDQLTGVGEAFESVVVE